MKRPARNALLTNPALAVGSPHHSVKAKPPDGGVSNFTIFKALALVSWPPPDRRHVPGLPAGLRGGFRRGTMTHGPPQMSGLLQWSSGWRTIVVSSHGTWQTILHPLIGHRPSWLDYQPLAVLTPPYHVENVLAARPGRPALLAAVAPAPTAGRLAGRGPLRPPPGHGRNPPLGSPNARTCSPGSLPRGHSWLTNGLRRG